MAKPKTNTKRNSRNKLNAINAIHIIVGLFAVAFTVFTFINPSSHLIFIPILFAVFGIFYITEAVYKIITRQRGRSNFFSIFIPILIALILFGLGSIAYIILK